MARLSLRLDQDVYQVVKKLEDNTDGKPFKSVPAVYDAIKRSNSSLSRQKKRTLEDAIDRVLQFRKDERDESDSEAELDQPEPRKADDDRFLLNRQMTKLWRQDTGKPDADKPSDERPKKKRRVQEEEERDGRSSGGDAVMRNGASDVADKTDSAFQKKSQKSSRHKVEQLDGPIRLGGVDESAHRLLRLMRRQLKTPTRDIAQNARPVPGVIIHGPQGTGKKSLVRSFAAELEVPLISMAGCFEDPERLDKSLTEAFDEAMRLAPCILFIEQLDLYMSSPGSGHNDHSRTAMLKFRRHMRRIEEQQPRDKPVLALATTSRILDIDQEILKHGLFEQTVELNIPNAEARQDIFKVATDDLNLADSVDLAQLAKSTHGFVGAEIADVVTIAQQIFEDRVWQEVKDQPQLDSAKSDQTAQPFDAPPTPRLSFEDFQAAIKGFTPHLRREGFTATPDVTWDQVGAMDKIRKQLEMSVVGPIREPALYRDFGIRRPAGVLLWGPPGCGKTLVAQAIANEAQASFILINGPELLNKYVGESEKAVRDLFDRARKSTPCIIFFDEIDSLVPSRDNASTEASARVVNTFLAELDGARDRSGVYVIGTTNRPDMIDSAMLRTGRLSVRLFIDLPTETERVDILRAIYRSSHTGKSPTPKQLGLLETVARDPRCADFSGADLDGLHNKAAECALWRWKLGNKTVMDIDGEDWEEALATTYRSVLEPETYREQAASFGRVS